MGGLFKLVLGTSAVIALCYLGWQEMYADVGTSQEISKQERAVDKAQFRKSFDHIAGVVPGNPAHQEDLVEAKSELDKAKAKKKGITENFDRARDEVNQVVKELNK
jgi:hypothetical protein